MEADCVGSIGRIVSWKKSHGYVYYISVGSNEYFYRSMTRSEHLVLLGIQGKVSIDVDEAVLSQCLLHPRYDKIVFDQKPAGEVDYIVKCINSSSGFSETDRVETDLDQQRQNLASLENQITILICKAFPHLTLEDINNFTYDEMVRYLAISEAILDVKLTIEKPKPNKGKIDFNAENRDMGGVPFDTNLNIPRGDVSV